MSDEPAVTAPPELAEPVVADDSPLSEHESVFGPADPTLDGDAKKANDEKRARVRHRAASQQAGPEDVPRIQKFTKDIRERDERLAAIEKENAELKARLSQPHTPQSARQDGQDHHGQATTSSQPSQQQQPAQLQPTRQKPTMDEIGDGLKYETFEAYNEDLVDWKHEQREAAREATDKQRREEQQRTEAQQSYQKATETFATKLAAFKANHADYDTLAAQHLTTFIPPAANRALLEHDNGPALVYHLFTHPDVLAEMQLLMDGRPPTADYVAIATRWLNARAQAVVTGSAAPKPPPKLAPPPPNPVRTGHTTTGDDIPDDDAPLSAHEAKWGQQRRR